jgi:hypothetical protein
MVLVSKIVFWVKLNAKFTFLNSQYSGLYYPQLFKNYYFYLSDCQSFHRFAYLVSSPLKSKYWTFYPK